MAENRKTKFAKKGEQILGEKAGSMEDLMQDMPTNKGDIAPYLEDTPREIRKTVFINYELNEKIRLLVFQKRYKSERAVIEAGLKLLMKKEGV